MVTIVVADDHKIVREGLVKLLEAREDFSLYSITGRVRVRF